MSLRKNLPFKEKQEEVTENENQSTSADLSSLLPDGIDLTASILTVMKEAAKKHIDNKNNPPPPRPSFPRELDDHHAAEVKSTQAQESKKPKISKNMAPPPPPPPPPSPTLFEARVKKEDPEVAARRAKRLEELRGPTITISTVNAGIADFWKKKRKLQEAAAKEEANKQNQEQQEAVAKEEVNKQDQTKEVNVTRLPTITLVEPPLDLPKLKM